MISNAKYLCSNRDEPRDAAFACIQKGCSQFGVCCANVKCECMRPHAEHQMMQFATVLAWAYASPTLSEQHSALEKQLDELIDGLIKQAEMLRQQHKEHIKRYIQSLLGDNALRKKLARREPLVTKEATGNSFQQMLSELEKAPVEGPYMHPPEDAKKLLVGLGRQVSSLVEKVRHMWFDNRPIPTKWTLSETLKHSDIDVIDGITCNTTTNYGMAILVEPALSMAIRSKISFKLHAAHNVVMGVCYRSNLEASGFNLQSNNCHYSVEAGGGAYTILEEGRIFSHSISSDRNRQTPVTYWNGDVITLEMDPSTGGLTYSRADGVKFTQDTSIRATTTEPVHFCVRPFGKGSMSILR